MEREDTSLLWTNKLKERQKRLIFAGGIQKSWVLDESKLVQG